MVLLSACAGCRGRHVSVQCKGGDSQAALPRELQGMVPISSNVSMPMICSCVQGSSVLKDSNDFLDEAATAVIQLLSVRSIPFLLLWV